MDKEKTDKVEQQYLEDYKQLFADNYLKLNIPVQWENKGSSFEKFSLFDNSKGTYTTSNTSFKTEKNYQNA